MNSQLARTCSRAQALLGALLLISLLVGCSHRPLLRTRPAPADQSTLSLKRESDLLHWQRDVTTTTVPASAGATEAARAIWDGLRRGPVTKDRLPLVERITGAIAAPLSQVLPSMEVSSVVEVCGLDTSHGSGLVWPHLTHLDRWVVIVRHDDYAALFTMGRKSSGWVYSPSSIAYPAEFVPGLALVPVERVLIATSDEEDTVSWWLLGRDRLGHESLVTLPYARDDKPLDSAVIWQHGPTLFSKSAR